MNITLKTELTQFWQHIQTNLFDFLPDIELHLTPRLQNLVYVLDTLEIERFVRPALGIDRPAKDRVALVVTSCTSTQPMAIFL